MWKNRSVLVTGGASFIGSHLVDSLLKRGAVVAVADDFSSGKLENLEYRLRQRRKGTWTSGSLSVHRLDLKDRAITRKMMRHTDVIFHLAAQHGGEVTFTRTPPSAVRAWRSIRSSSRRLGGPTLSGSGVWLGQT